MTRAAGHAALFALLAIATAQAGETRADSSNPAASIKPAQLQPALTAAKAPVAAIRAAEPIAQTPAAPRPPVTAPKPPAVDTLKPAPAATPGAMLPDPRRDSAGATVYRVSTRPYKAEDAKKLQSALAFRLKGKPESTAVNWVFRDEKGALITYEHGKSEWSYANESVAFLDPKEYVPDSLIRTRTDGILKEVLKGKAEQYSFVNYEKTMIQPRDEQAKEGVAPAVPAFYIGRYLRKLDGRFVLGENFQVRVEVGRGNALSMLSWREPQVTPSHKAKVPTREMVSEYLAKWAKEPGRLGRRTYPYHPDNLRIRALKPVKVFESYVLAREKFREDPSKDGTYLVPRITVLAEATLAKSQKRLKLPHPTQPVLLHFHFPCTPGAGLCWPDGPQGLEHVPPPEMGQRPPMPPSPTTTPPANSPKSGAAPAPAPAAPTAPAQTVPAKP